MNKLLIVTCVAAVALVGVAVALPTGEAVDVQVQDNEAERGSEVTIEQCIEALASSVKNMTVSVPASVTKFVTELEAMFPHDEHDWSQMDEDDDEELPAIYPLKSCDEHLGFMTNLSESTFKDQLEVCNDLTEDNSDETVKLAAANPTLRPIFFANMACASFMPSELSAGDLIRECIDTLASNVEEASVPVDVAEFVEKVKAEFPQEKYNWWRLEENEQKKLAAFYPEKSCNEHLDFMTNLTEGTFQGELGLCSVLIEKYEAGTVDIAEENPIVRPILFAGMACASFKPW